MSISLPETTCTHIKHIKGGYNAAGEYPIILSEMGFKILKKLLKDLKLQEYGNADFYAQ